jgi:hypothetical protein
MPSDDDVNADFVSSLIHPQHCSGDSGGLFEVVIHWERDVGYLAFKCSVAFWASVQWVHLSEVAISWALKE